MTSRVKTLGASAAAILALLLGVLAAWPIYRTWWLLVPAAVGLIVGVGVAVLGARRLSGLATAGALLVAFVLTVVPVALPQSFERLPLGLMRGLLDGVAAVVLGWKQLLTLTLPVGTYQAVMVPAYLVFLLSAFLATTIALRAGRFAPLAAFPLMMPVAFGTVFGSSVVSAPLKFGPLSVAAPRELGLWIAAAGLGAAWVWFSSGAERRAALRRGRTPGTGNVNRGRVFRAGLGVSAVVVSLIAGLAIAPALGAGERQVPRDRIDPEIVLRERPSPLASYRSWKQNGSFDTEMFSVSSSGAMPERLRLAVLDAYDGVDFHVSTDDAGRFTRFPSGEPVSDPVEVTIRVGAGYNDIWVPTAGLGSVPSFSGARAEELADAFYVNRATGAAIAVPGGTSTGGLEVGDGLTAIMQASAGPVPSGGPLADAALIDLEAMPELEAWLEAQDQPATADGLVELVQRLRDRGYLSHSISQTAAGDQGDLLWLERLRTQYGASFESSTGGHSLARIEQLFAQLNTQERLAGEGATPPMLVAAVGDDEQFAAAAALIARALGFDSRVVLGVRLGAGESSAAEPGLGAEVPGVPTCQGQCTGEHLAAWIEVHGDGGSWAALDVTPQVENRPTTLEEGEQLPEFATTPEERDAREVDPPLGLGERNEDSEDTEAAPAASWLLPVLRTAGLSLSALLFLALPLLFLPFAKRRRAKDRRAASDPEVRVLGAWKEMVDGARDAGVVIPDGASRAQIAELLGTAPARWAAQTADRAVFSAQGVAAHDAEWMWAAVDADRAERQSGQSRWQRLRAAYALRSYGVRIVTGHSRAAESASSPFAGR